MWYLSSLVSAITLYVLPFYYPSIFWWAIFFFPVPLFLYIAYNENSFLYGYLFGFFSLACHLQGVFRAVFYMGNGFWFYKALPFLFNITYHAFFAGLFFWISQYVIKGLKLEHNHFFKIIITFFALYGFIMYMDLVCLVPFGKCEGYFLMNPLVPLASFPSLLSVLLVPGRAFATFLVLFFSVCTTMFLLYNSYIFLLCLVSFFCMLLVLKNIVNHNIPVPTWYTKIAAIPIAFAPQYNLTFLTTQVADVIKKHLAAFPDTKLFIMPESSFYCEQLAMPTLSNLWGDKVVGKKVHVLAGAFRWKQDNYFNSMHWVYDGVLQKCFDKRHAMVLTERLPTILQFSFWQRIFFNNRSQITPSIKNKKYITIDDTCTFVPYICSELFFNYYPDDDYGNTPIVAICNDQLLSGYVARLMFLAAIFQSIAWQRTIVYVSFVHQAVILPNGDTIPLKKVA